MVAGDPLAPERLAPFGSGHSSRESDPAEYALPEAPRAFRDRAHRCPAQCDLHRREARRAVPQPPRRIEGRDAGGPPPDRCAVPGPGGRAVERDVAGCPQGGGAPVSYYALVGMAYLLWFVIVGLGVAVSVVAFRAYRSNRSRPYLLLGVGFLLISIVAGALWIGVYLMLDNPVLADLGACGAMVAGLGAVLASVLVRSA